MTRLDRALAAVEGFVKGPLPDIAAYAFMIISSVVVGIVVAMWFAGPE